MCYPYVRIQDYFLGGLQKLRYIGNTPGNSKKFAKSFLERLKFIGEATPEEIKKKLEEIRKQ